MPRNPIACRYYSYEPFLEGAFAHLASLGVRHIELPVPTPAELPQLQAELKQHGLTATSLHGACEVARPDIAQQVAEQMPTFAALGTRIMFVSVKAEGLPLPTAYERLRAAGEVAGRHGVTIVLETHPDLVTNGDVARATVQGVNHPHVKINYDTANVYFYNHNISAVTELQKVVKHVAAVHLKETDGGYRHWHFPALGKGCVDFPGVFRVLDEAGYTGPYTLEIEGIEGEEKSAALTHQRIADSVAYLKSLGRF